MTELNLRQINALCTVARLGSFTRAAEELYVGQPAVSQHVAALERALGTPLVYRAARGGTVRRRPRRPVRGDRASTQHPEGALPSRVNGRGPDRARAGQCDSGDGRAGVAGGRG